MKMPGKRELNCGERCGFEVQVLKKQKGYLGKKQLSGIFQYWGAKQSWSTGMHSCSGECGQAWALPHLSAGEQIPPRMLKIPTPCTPQGSFPLQENSRMRKEPGKRAGLGFCSPQVKPWRNKPPKEDEQSQAHQPSQLPPEKPAQTLWLLHFQKV